MMMILMPLMMMSMMIIMIIIRMMLMMSLMMMTMFDNANVVELPLIMMMHGNRETQKIIMAMVIVAIATALKTDYTHKSGLIVSYRFVYKRTTTTTTTITAFTELQTEVIHLKSLQNCKLINNIQGISFLSITF